MNKNIRNAALLASTFMLAAPMAAQAIDARDLGYIRGMDTRDGERALRSRGFDRVSEQRRGRSTISYWWDRDDCIRVTDSRGEIVSLSDVSDRYCRTNDSSGRDDWSDLRGARASSAMTQLERRGFRQVDNFTSGNTRYSIQYNDRRRQCIQLTIADGRIYDINDIGRHPECRPGNSRPSYDRPSYTQPRINWYRELDGEPAPASRNRLIAAGFVSVFIENAGQRTIYFNRASGQCLLMLARNRTVTSVREIANERRCR